MTIVAMNMHMDIQIIFLKSVVFWQEKEVCKLKINGKDRSC